MKTKILEKFKALYGDGAVCYASPGRVNLIGEHTDYNMGFVCRAPSTRRFMWRLNLTAAR